MNIISYTGIKLLKLALPAGALIILLAGCSNSGQTEGEKSAAELMTIDIEAAARQVQEIPASQDLKLAGCRTEPIKEPDIIDLTNFHNQYDEILMSVFISDLEYIPLESIKSSMIGPAVSFFADDSVIISIAFKQILVFDRNTGKFLREIGEQGRGPKAYWATRSGGGSVDFNNKLIYASGYDHLVCYSFEGETVSGPKVPYEYKNTTRLNENLFASYIANQSGNESRKIVITDAKSGNVEKIFPNYQTYKKIPGKYIMYSYGESWFYHFNDKLIFKEYLNDTLFEITSDKLIPRYIFNSGKYSLPYEERETLKSVEYHNIYNIYETSSFLCFRINYDKRTYYAVYDKSNKTCKVANLKNQKISGYTNDINGFMQFCPKSFNENTNEITAFLEPHDILNWIRENPEKTSELPPYIQKLKNLDEMDNPVVVIAKLKE